MWTAEGGRIYVSYLVFRVEVALRSKEIDEHAVAEIPLAVDSRVQIILLDNTKGAVNSHDKLKD